MIENIRTNPISTFGDILLFLKFDIRQFDFYYPCMKETRVDNYMDLVIGFNVGTGPSRNLPVGEEFHPYTTGLADFRLGWLYSQVIKDFSLDIDFVYTFAQYLGEDYLPFSETIWSSEDRIYAFGITEHHRPLQKEHCHRYRYQGTAGSFLRRSRGTLFTTGRSAARNCYSHSPERHPYCAAVQYIQESTRRSRSVPEHQVAASFIRRILLP